jgi:D-alanyl-D-alanine dipeptidase
MVMTILLADPRVASVPVHETYQPLVTLGASFGPARARVRAAVAARLRRAQVALPVGMSLRVIEGHRSAVVQASLATPIDVAPHVTGAAIDVTLADAWGSELDLGAPIDASAEERELDPTEISGEARGRRQLLARVLTGVGLVNCPAAWWHWSYGDRYWALLTGAGAAAFGPIRDLDGPLDDPAGVVDGEAGRWLRNAA